MRQFVCPALIAPKALGDAAAVNAVALNSDRLPSVFAHQLCQPAEQPAASGVHWHFKGIHNLLTRYVFPPVPINPPLEPTCWRVPWVVQQYVVLINLFGSRSFCRQKHSTSEGR